MIETVKSFTFLGGDDKNILLIEVFDFLLRIFYFVFTSFKRNLFCPERKDLLYIKIKKIFLSCNLFLNCGEYLDIIIIIII